MEVRASRRAHYIVFGAATAALKRPLARKGFKRPALGRGVPRESPRADLLSPAQARAIYAYNARAFARFARAIRRLPWRQVRRRREIGHQSLFDTLVHILNVHEVWLGYILQGRTSDPELEALFADPVRRPRSWPAFRRYERRVWETVDRYLAETTSRELRRPVHVFWMPGRYVASDGILQASIEQAHHLGEVIGALWQDDVEPPEMTWIRLTRSRAKR
jgi:uncharacterized damage-inducible protein DinB